MTDLFLIAHKVRGEPTFDIAIRLELADEDGDDMWIIPTSGHRAFPYFAEPLDLMVDWEMARIHDREVGEMPADLPDHYPPRAEPTTPKVNLLAELGLKRTGHAIGKISRRL